MKVKELFEREGLDRPGLGIRQRIDYKFLKKLSTIQKKIELAKDIGEKEKLHKQEEELRKWHKEQTEKAMKVKPLFESSKMTKEEYKKKFDQLYNQYKQRDIEELKRIYNRSHRVSDLRGLTKSNIITDIIHSEIGYAPRESKKLNEEIETLSQR